MGSEDTCGIMGLSHNLKNLIGQTLFRLVYGQEFVMPLEYIVPSLRIAAINEMTNVGVVEEILSQLIQVEEYRFVAGYQQGL